MGTLAAVLAREGIATPEDKFRAEVEGDIESLANVLKITQIRVHYYLRTSSEKVAAARNAMSHYLSLCPAAQSLRECIDIRDSLVLENDD